MFQSSQTGGTGSVAFQLEKSPIGYPVSSFGVTFTDDTTAYYPGGGQVEKTIVNITVTGTGSGVTGLLD